MAEFFEALLLYFPQTVGINNINCPGFNKKKECLLCVVSWSLAFILVTVICIIRLVFCLSSGSHRPISRDRGVQRVGRGFVFDSEELEVIRRGRNRNTGLGPPLVRDLVSVPLLSAGDSSRDGGSCGCSR